MSRRGGDGMISPGLIIGIRGYGIYLSASAFLLLPPLISTSLADTHGEVCMAAARFVLTLTIGALLFLGGERLVSPLRPRSADPAPTVARDASSREIPLRTAVHLFLVLALVGVWWEFLLLAPLFLSSSPGSSPDLRSSELFPVLLGRIIWTLVLVLAALFLKRVIRSVAKS